MFHLSLHRAQLFGAVISICIFRLQLALHLASDVAFIISCVYARSFHWHSRCGWYADAERIYDRGGTRSAFRCLIARERSSAVAVAIALPPAAGGWLRRDTPR